MLAETAGGSVGRFARAMDAESQTLGLRGSSWRNPNGLDARGTARPRSTWPSWPGPS
jgi:D-alanyl-D-alanine carboxypeptidase